ncbi:type I restriction modification DNA specificity domain protein [Streptococcus cristatus ATCC 51100]|uniref:Type I restriction modification DNA specificity domain protein n=2 Tax=Streptococcus cristatus TaxID=45634 RepID=A0AAV3ED14_STRCR|nr:type I restriction modification DNA specificity domain protein [Streptococcus cristatus ATCC 51100]
MLKDMVVDVEIDNEKQKRIAKSILIIDQKIQINNQINQELEAMAKTLYDYWFVQFDFPDQNGKPYKSSGGKMVYNPELKREIPEGWGVEKLKDKLSVSRGISYKTENIKDNIGTPMINLASIDINRNYKSTGLKYFNGEYLKEKIVSGGDLLIACTDLTRNADIVGSPIIVPFDEQKYVFSMDLAKIDSKVDFINKYYLYSTLRTEHYHNYIKKWASGTNVLHLNLDGMNWYSISVPPIELQEEYSQIILNFSKKTNKNIQENQELTQLRDWLLPMLMNGQVKVE